MAAKWWPCHFPSLVMGNLQWSGVVLCWWRPVGVARDGLVKGEAAHTPYLGGLAQILGR